MPNTYECIATTTTTTNVSSVTFTGISSAYTDLFLVYNFVANTDGEAIQMRLNNSIGGSEYTDLTLTGEGSGASGNANNDSSFWRAGYWQTGGPRSTVQMWIFDYASTNKFKHAWSRQLQSGTNLNRNTQFIHTRTNTSAVTSIQLAASLGNILSGSTFSLYGILKA